MGDYSDLGDQLSMTEIIRLQDALSRALTRRFEKRLGLVFSDVVGSTSYFAKFGDEAGRKLQQRHLDLVSVAVDREHGRVVDTAGDGAFLCFPDVDAGIRATMELQQRIAADNESYQTHQQLAVRVGVHFGPVLTDGEQVSGDSVNVCARIASTASPGEIRISRDGVQALGDVKLRFKCRPLEPVRVKGIEHPLELSTLDWLDHTIFPACVRISDSSQLVPLPAQSVIRFGRLKEQDGVLVNDIVLQAPNPVDSNRISRWHFELYRRSTGFLLRCLSGSLTEVDGRALSKAEEAPIRVGTKVSVGGVLSLEFMGDPLLELGDETRFTR